MLEKAEFASEHIKGITAWSKKIKNSHNQHFIEVLEAKNTILKSEKSQIQRFVNAITINQNITIITELKKLLT